MSSYIFIIYIITRVHGIYFIHLIMVNLFYIVNDIKVGSYIIIKKYK